MKNKNKGFTLIELVAVLVILAILALIVTPLVLNIIRKARTSADKRSIDAYGRSVEIAVANYLLETTNFPTSIDSLKIEYKGDEVICSKRTLNKDGSVYLADCTVGGRSVDYIYGKTSENSDEPSTSVYQAYKVGDEVTYNNIDYYVIKDSSTTESSVTLLKAEPITSSEISPYLSSTEVASKVDTSGTYAKMSYYSRDNCASSGDQSGCSADYSVSDIKQVVDIWNANYASGATNARLITLDELVDNFGYKYDDSNPTSEHYIPTTNTPSWAYNSNYYYWTMSPYNDSESFVWCVYDNVGVGALGIFLSNYITVRPVITISKSSL